MPCSCYIPAGLAAGSVFAAFYSGPARKAFVSLLDPEQRALFAQIRQSRLNIYLISLTIGAGLAFAITRATAASGPGAVCTASLLMMGISYACYVAWPKGPFMLDHLTRRDQVRAWLTMYRGMVRVYHTGFALGVAAFALLVWTTCGNAARPGVEDA